MRQMRLAKREVRDFEALRAIVEACDVVRIGAVDESGMFIVPVNFGYEWEDRPDGPGERLRLTLYIHSAAEGRKAESFSRGCDVAIEMDCDGGTIKGDYSCAYSRAYRSIMGMGRIRPIEDAAEKVRSSCATSGWRSLLWSEGMGCGNTDSKAARVDLYVKFNINGLLWKFCLECRRTDWYNALGEKNGICL